MVEKRSDISLPKHLELNYPSQENIENCSLAFRHESQIFPHRYHFLLHAKILGITHPSTGEYIEFDAPLPEYFKDLLNKLRKQN